MDSNDFCNANLALGLGSSSYASNNLDSNRLSQTPPSSEEKEKTATRLLKFDDRALPISLSLGTPAIDGGSSSCRRLYRQNSSISPGSSYSNSPAGNNNGGCNNNNNNNNHRIVIKRERLILGDQNQFCVDEEVELSDDKVVGAAGVGLTTSDHDHDEDDEASPRKKLRLNKEQSAVLEDAFKEHSTLNPNQKQALAKQLNLRPRQVEVWFQNRRARTKLKQTEMDLEMLKKCCETLTEENKRLHKELQELKLSPPVYMQVPTAAALTMCPSCERIMTTAASASTSSTVVAGGGDSSTSNIKGRTMTKFSMEQQQNKTGGTAAQTAKFCSPFTTTQSSAACCMK